MNIVIVGAGLTGLAAAWRLAQAGASVTIVERAVAGRGASWAAAGMLAPGAEIVEAGDEPDGAAVGRFARTARALWPGFAAELEQASGHRVRFRACGSLLVAHDDARARMLKALAAGTDCVWLEPGPLRAREPLVSPWARGALLAPGDAHVDNRALCPALLAALARLAVPVRENCEVAGLVIENARIRGVALCDRMLAADAVVLATGAWLSLMGGAGDFLPAVSPAKGQMLALVPPEGVALPHALLWDEQVYLVGHGDKMFAGATVEDAGFDRTVENDAAAKLRAGAARLVPATSSWRFAEIWAGFRPRTPDGAPVLGESTVQGLYVAGGQFRNGILFAPAMAAGLRALVLEGAFPPEFREYRRAFDPNRILESEPA